MTESATKSHETDGVSGGQNLFPPAELEGLHVADREAARNIVCLLGGLFIVGLVLYTFVCIWTH
jgi:hypothetical protein